MKRKLVSFGMSALLATCVASPAAIAYARDAGQPLSNEEVALLEEYYGAEELEGKTDEQLDELLEKAKEKKKADDEVKVKAAAEEAEAERKAAEEAAAAVEQSEREAAGQQQQSVSDGASDKQDARRGDGGEQAPPSSPSASASFDKTDASGGDSKTSSEIGSGKDAAFKGAGQSGKENATVPSADAAKSDDDKSSASAMSAQSNRKPGDLVVGKPAVDFSAEPAKDDSADGSVKSVEAGAEVAVETAAEEKVAEPEKLDPADIPPVEEVIESLQYGGHPVNFGNRGHVDMTTEKFIAVIGEQARYIAQENDLYASVMIAQAILESASGNSGLSQAPNNNLFGIKGTYNGSGVDMATQEDDGTGNHYGITATFRKYPTTSESMQDYAALLSGVPDLYKGAWKSQTTSYLDACNSLQGVYATSTSYAQSLADIIETYDLKRFDEPLPYKVVGKIHDPESPEADADGHRPLTQADYIALEAEATSYLGTDYVWGGDSPITGFDCSGLVQWSYNKAMGIQLPRTTYVQKHEGVEVPIDVDQLRMGDLLFFDETGKDTHHVAMYLGDGYYIHAPETGDVVKVTSIEEYTPTFAKRVIEFEPVDADAASKSELVKKQVGKVATEVAASAVQTVARSLCTARDVEIGAGIAALDVRLDVNGNHIVAARGGCAA